MSRKLPRLIASKRVRVRRTRLLPIPGKVLLQAGDRVTPDDIVAWAETDGLLHRMNAATVLSVTASDVPSILQVAAGDSVQLGQVLGERKRIWGGGYRRLVAPADGMVESVSARSGEVLVRERPGEVRLRACVSGVVRDVVDCYGVEIEGDVFLVQGVLGIGGEAVGKLVLGGTELFSRFLETAEKKALRDGIVVTEQRVQLSHLRRLEDLGARGVVAGSIDGLEMVNYKGAFVNPASTGHEQVGLTIMLTEGFGDLEMQSHIFGLLTELEGRVVTLSGATQMRAFTRRPELLSSPLGEVPSSRDEGTGQSASREGEIAPEMPVRVARGRHLGKMGIIKKILRSRAKIETGAEVSALEIELPGGQVETIPLCNVEIV